MKIPSVNKDVDQLKLSYRNCRNVIWKIVWQFTKLNTYPLYDLYLAKRNETISLDKDLDKNVMTALFVTDSNFEQPKCPSMVNGSRKFGMHTTRE